LVAQAKNPQRFSTLLSNLALCHPNFIMGD